MAVNATNGGIFSGLLSTLFCVGLIILVIAGVFFVIRRRRSGFGQSAMPMGNPMPYQPISHIISPTTRAILPTMVVPITRARV